MRRPLSYRCQGFNRKNESFYCIEQCPEQALAWWKIRIIDLLGIRAGAVTCSDTRWMAEFGTLPYTDIEYRTGESGGGFDKMRFIFPREFKD